jgi:hypothetical protein
MNLIDLVLKLEQENANSIMPREGDGKCLISAILKENEKRLYECDEFKSVVRINFIDMPNFLVDKETGEPISSHRDFLGGETRVEESKIYKFKQGDEIKFNKIVDLYSIQIAPLYNINTEIKKPGIWIFPTYYDPKTFLPMNEIRVLWDPTQLEEAVRIINDKENSKDRILRMFKQALDDMQPNIPCEYVIMIRCSDRSLQLGERAPVDNQIPGEPPVIDMDIPPVS